MNFDFILAFAIMMVIFALGDVISGLTRGKLPSVFVISVLMLIGYWTVLPKDILTISQLEAVGQMSISLILIHMGTLLDFEELKREWKTVAIVMGAIVGIVVFLAVVIIPIFGLQTFAVVVPPVTGGGMAALIMTTAAQAKGLVQLAILSILMFLTQSFVAAPITAYALRTEGKRLKEEFAKGQKLGKQEHAETEAKKTRVKLIDRIPAKLKTPAFYLATLALVALFNSRCITPFTQGFVDKSIIDLFLGILLAGLGLIDRAPLQKSDSFGIMMIGLIAVIVGYLNQATSAMLLSLIGPIAISLMVAVVGVMVFSTVIGKKLGYSKAMSFAIGLNCFLGFPFNYSITSEAVSVIADNQKEHEYLMSLMLPNMLIAGFVSVTIVSVVLAGVFVKFI